MKPLNWPQATLYPRYRGGWKVVLRRSDFGQDSEHYFLNGDNAISYLVEPDSTQAWMESRGAMPRNLYLALSKKYWRMNKERDYTLVSPTNESEGGWMTVELGGESNYYGEFEVLPSIYFLLRGGYLDRNLLREEDILVQPLPPLEGLEDENSVIFNEVLDRIIGEDSTNATFLWEGFLLPGLKNYFRESEDKYTIMFNFEREGHQYSKFSGRMSPWDGPKWEDEVVE